MSGLVKDRLLDAACAVTTARSQRSHQHPRVWVIQSKNGGISLSFLSSVTLPCYFPIRPLERFRVRIKLTQLEKIHRPRRE